MAPQANEIFKDRVIQTDHEWSRDPILTDHISRTKGKEYKNQKIRPDYRAASNTSPGDSVVIPSIILFSILCIFIGIIIFLKCKRRRSNEDAGSLPSRSAQPAITSDRMDFEVVHLFGRVQKEDGVLKFSLPCTLQSNIPLPSSSSTYYEFQLLCLPIDSTVRVGLSHATTSDPCLKVFNKDSIYLDLKNGQLQLGSDPTVYNAVAPFKAGDVVGCLVDLHPTCSIRFSNNGVWGDIKYFPNPGTNLFPTIYATFNCQVAFNFGSSEFIYGLASTPIPSYYSANPPEIQHIGRLNIVIISL
ncbi:Protein ssh4 [Entomophthora muscae]|uniref:Protein ssh4 n=1 Tax=Entomophthora muscae TaxID=34485 RepID=A0ACC2RWB3_9FUNG|nr:Protein ssh4 [Entomophthora muscae]